MQRWSKHWEEKLEIWKNMKPEERAKHFKTYMERDYKKSGKCYHLLKDEIKKKIEAKTKEISYVFDEDDDVAFGGKKMKNKSKSKTKNKRKNVYIVF